MNSRNFTTSISWVLLTVFLGGSRITVAQNIEQTPMQSVQPPVEQNSNSNQIIRVIKRESLTFVKQQENDTTYTLEIAKYSDGTTVKRLASIVFNTKLKTEIIVLDDYAPPAIDINNTTSNNEINGKLIDLFPPKTKVNIKKTDKFIEINEILVNKNLIVGLEECKHGELRAFAISKSDAILHNDLLLENSNKDNRKIDWFKWGNIVCLELVKY